MYSFTKEFITQYLETALWAELDESGTPIDENHCTDEIDLRSAILAVRDCLNFINQAGDLLEQAEIDYSQAGHDFWLTRNHHGAGFWDRGHGVIGEQLTEICEKFGALYIAPYENKNEDTKLEIR